MRDQKRFTHLYELHYERVLQYAMRRTDPSSSRDLAADVFLVAWRRIGDVPLGDREALMWLYGTSRRVLANMQRSKVRQSRLSLRLLTASRDIPIVEHDFSDRSAERSWLLRLLCQLSAQDQEALQLATWEDLDIESAARVVGCTPSAMRSRTHRALVRLRALAEEQQDETPIMQLTTRRSTQESYS